MVRIAAAQIKVTKNTFLNAKAILKNIVLASKKNVDIICFPEAALLHSKNSKEIKKTPLDSYVSRIQAACKRFKIHCIFGTKRYDAKTKKVFNSSFVIDNKGKILRRYDKVHLWKKETNTCTGSANTPITTKFGKIGVMICWDIAHPQQAQELAKKGAWLLFYPSYVLNYKRELISWEQLPLARSFENQAAVVVCDAATKETVSYSQICTPQKIVKSIRGKEGMIIADIDKRKIMGLRKYYRLP